MRRIHAAVAQRVVGQDAAIEDALVTFLARGHLLIEGVPGTAKTLLVRVIARLFNCEFKRIQFTPDLMPADITGTNVFDPRDQSFHFRSGPVFSQLILGDEINRAPPKTQAALLEAMQERQVTVDGVSYKLPAVFTVFMLFLPAGLGVYMFTNSILGIAQQQLVERHAKQSLAERQARMGGSEIVDPPSRRRAKS